MFQAAAIRILPLMPPAILGKIRFAGFQRIHGRETELTESDVEKV